MTKSIWSVTIRYLFLLFLLSISAHALHGMKSSVKVDAGIFFNAYFGMSDEDVVLMHEYFSDEFTKLVASIKSMAHKDPSRILDARRVALGFSKKEFLDQVRLDGNVNLEDFQRRFKEVKQHRLIQIQRVMANCAGFVTKENMADYYLQCLCGMNPQQVSLFKKDFQHEHAAYGKQLLTNFSSFMKAYVCSNKVNQSVDHIRRQFIKSILHGIPWFSFGEGACSKEQFAEAVQQVFLDEPSALSEFMAKRHGLSPEDRELFKSKFIRAQENGSLGDPFSFAVKSQRPVQYEDGFSEFPVLQLLKSEHGMSLKEITLFKQEYPNEFEGLQERVIKTISLEYSGVVIDGEQEFATREAVASVTDEDILQAIEKFKQQPTGRDGELVQQGHNDYSGDLSLSEFTDKYDGLSSEDRQRFNRNLVTALENGSLGEPSVFAAGVAESQRPVKYDDFLSLSELPACNFLKRVYDMNFQDVRLFFKTFPNESAQLHKCLSGIFLESPENIASADVEQYRNFCKHSLTLKKVKKFARSCNVDFEDVEQAIKQFKQQAAESASFPFTMRPDDTGNGGEVVLTQDQLQNVPQWMFNNVDGGEPFALLAGVEESQRPVRYEEDLLSLQQQARPGVEVSRGGNIVNYIVDFSPKLQPQMDDRYKTACKKFDSPSSIIDHVLSRLFSIDRAGVACFQEKYSRHYGVIGNSILSYRKTRFYSYFIEQSFDPKSLSGYTKYFDDLVKSAGVSVTNFLFKGYSEKGLKKLCNAVKRSNKQGQTAGQRKNSENRGSIKEQRASSDVALAELLSLKSTDVQKKKKSGGKKGRGGKKRGRNKKKKKKKAQSKKKRTTTPALPTEPAVHIPHDTPNSPSDSDENSTMLQVVAQTDQDNASGMPVQDEGVSKEQVGLECAEAVAAFGGWEKIVCCFLKHVCPLLSTEQRGVLCQTSERTDEVLGQQAVFRQGTVQRFVKALFSERYLFYKERHGSDVGSCLINALVVKDCGNYEYNRNFYGTHFDQSIKRVLENGILDQEIGNEDNNLVLLKAREKEIGLDITYPFFAELYQLTGLDYERIKHDQKFYLSLQHCVAGIFANHFYKNANQYNKKHGPEKWKTELTLDIMRSAGFLGNDLLAHINEDDMREEVGRLRALHMPEETQ